MHHGRGGGWKVEGGGPGQQGWAALGGEGRGSWRKPNQTKLSQPSQAWKSKMRVLDLTRRSSAGTRVSSKGRRKCLTRLDRQHSTA